ncbi:MAG: hypothetical protein QG563_262, partial [Patescibacteria group bacterium]|nr:hypothetical protein [Patescibacteria group bacterium]
MQLLKKYLKMKLVGSLLALFVVTCIFHFGILLAAYSSSDVIGQTDGSGEADYVGGSRNDGIVTNSNFGMVNPGGIAFDPAGQKIFIVDTSTHRILVFNTDAFGVPLDHFADAVLGQQDFYDYTPGTTAATLSTPEDVEFDSVRNYLYVSDSSNNRVLVFDVATVTTGESAIKVLGQPDLVTGDFNVTADGMGNPTGIEFFNSTTDLLFVADTDNSRVLVYDLGTDASGVTTGQSATRVLGQSDFVSFTGTLTATGLYAPSDVAVFDDEMSNYLFVADVGNNRVVTYNIDVIVNGEAGILFLGQEDATSFNIDCTFGANTFCIPVSLDVQVRGSVNKLWVSDSNHNRIVGFTIKPLPEALEIEHVYGHTDVTGGTPGSTFFTSTPRYVNYFNTDLLFVSADNDHRVVVFDVNTPIDGEVAIDVYGQITNGNVDLDSIENYFPFNNQISSTGLDIEGNSSHTYVDTTNHKMYVSDSANNRV